MAADQALRIRGLKESRFTDALFARPLQLLSVTVIFLCIIWILNSKNFHQISRTDLISSSLMYRPHFLGSQGLADLDKLIKWNDELFMSTMTTYKLKARDLCLTDRTGCSVATNKKRPPEPMGFEKYDMFNPYVGCPHGHSLQRVGDQKDGGKWLCTDIMKKDDCVVFSLGSDGNYIFEQDLLGSTKCNIYTFDCTYAGSSQGPRHKYINKCIGTAAKETTDEKFTTLENAVKELGISSIDLLKIDIEGYEFDETAYWSIKDSWLPEQVAIEVHHSQAIYSGKGNNTDFSNLLWPVHELYLSDLALFFGHLGHLGYAIASREDNPFGTCCAEFLLIRVADWL